MTDISILTMTAGGVPTLFGITTLVIGYRLKNRADDLIRKADDIHLLVNSNLSKVKADLEIANSRVLLLEKTLGELRDKIFSDAKTHN